MKQSFVTVLMVVSASLPNSLITHGFGTPAVCAALSTFQTVLSEMLNYLDKNSSGKTSGPTDQQINNSSEKTQLRKTAEPQSKDGKTDGHGEGMKDYRERTNPGPTAWEVSSKFIRIGGRHRPPVCLQLYKQL